MTEKYNRVEQLIREAAPDWEWQHYAKIREGVEKRRRGSMSVRFAALTVTLASVAAAVTTFTVLELPKMFSEQGVRPSVSAQGRSPANEIVPPGAPPSTELVAPTTGLEIRATRAGTVVRPVPSASHTTYELAQGEATFAVSQPLAKPLAIQVRDLVVKDIGTTFSVAMHANKMVVVSVSEGLVQVTGPKTNVLIEAGHTRSFPWVNKDPVAATKSASAGAKQTSDSQPTPADATSERASAPPPWIELAEGKQYQEAYDRLAAEPPVEANLSAGQLLLAADAARLSHHERQALPFLDNYLSRFSQHEDVPLVHFTKGKILMSLGQYAEAAAVFEVIQAGVLAEEAMVRAIEARVRAGERQSAEALSREYGRRFPSGSFHGRIASLLR